MKKWKSISSILMLLSVVPITLFGYRERFAQTQKEVEIQAVTTQYQLKSTMNNSDFFSEDDYYRAAAMVYVEALKRYPESVELGQRIQDLTLERCRDNTVPETERTALKDSLASFYRDQYEKNKKSETFIYLYARTQDDYEKCLKLADEILKLDKKSYWGHELKGWAACALERYEETEKSLKRAIEIDSVIPDAYADLVTLYYKTARPKELIDAALKAYELASHPMLVVKEFWLARDKAEGLGDYESILKLDRARLEKRTAVDKEVIVDISYDFGLLANTYLALGRVDSARLNLEYMLAYTTPLGEKSQSWAIFKQAKLEASQGNKEKAFDLLEKAQKNGLTSYATVSSDTVFSAFKNDARFMELLLKMKNEAKEEALSSPLNTPVPDLILVSFEGDTINLSSLKGKPFILDFWPACCPGVGPYTMKVLEKFQTTHRDIPIYGVGEVYDLQGTIALNKEWDVKLPNLISTTEIREAFGVIGGPYIFVMDSNGMMKYYHLGYSYGEAFEQTLLDELEWWIEAVK